MDGDGFGNRAKEEHKSSPSLCPLVIAALEQVHVFLGDSHQPFPKRGKGDGGGL